ncbi:MAG: helix-turn-helix transcriptional regulator [Clostridia bacterium]|nr:helix-turn-helix transcriptional regulator [Clostridia bacterium]
MKITKIGEMWPESSSFSLEREDTGERYIFVHLLTPAILSDKTGIHPCSAGSCICYDAHSYQYLAASEGDLLHNWAHMTGNVKEVADRYGFQMNTIYHVDNDRFVTDLIQSAGLELLQRKSFHEDICTMKMSELFIRLVRTQKEGMPIISKELHDALLSLRTEVHMRYAESWDVESMAKLLNLSSSRFYALYKTVFGISPKQDLRNIRIEHAKNLLKRKQYSVKEIANMVGYSNEYYFIRCFKEITGKTPGKFV